MACQVEMINGNGTLNDRESSPENESDIEIMTLKQTLKDKLLNDNVNGSSVEAASSSNSSFNGIGTVENGHANDKLNTDSEFENDSVVVERQTPKRVSKGKFAKGKKEKTASPKSKRRTPVKKVAHEEECTVSEQSWESIELASKDIEDDTSTIDVGDNEDSAIVEEGECSTQDQDFEKIRTEPLYEKSKDQNGPSVFSRLRDSMRFSISPRKQEPTTSTSNTADKEMNSFRNLSGRRALHQTPPRYSFKDESVGQKRKADSEDSDEPRQKYFMTSLADRSPGWKLFSSPFPRFWSPNKSVVNTSVSSSTPLRKLHEDVRDDSMTVNVNDSLNISLEDEEMNIENEEKVQDLEEKQEIEQTEKSTAHASWKCSIM